MKPQDTFTRRQSAKLAIAAALPAALLTRQAVAAEESTPGGDKVQYLFVELSNPVLEKDKLTYDIKVLEGSIPKAGGECSLFIDVIGRPLTPISYVGVARRTRRRRVARY